MQRMQLDTAAIPREHTKEPFFAWLSYHGAAYSTKPLNFEVFFSMVSLRKDFNHLTVQNESKKWRLSFETNLCNFI